MQCSKIRFYLETFRFLLLAIIFSVSKFSSISARRSNRRDSTSKHVQAGHSIRGIVVGKRVQLHRALSKLGFGSRKVAWGAILAGRVFVNGAVVRDPLEWVDLEQVRQFQKTMFRRMIRCDSISFSDRHPSQHPSMAFAVHSVQLNSLNFT